MIAHTRNISAGRFASLGEFARVALDTIGKPEAQWDGRLQSASMQRGPTGASVADPTGGGFLVDPAFSKTPVESLYAESPILPLCTQLEGDPRGVKVPAVDETSRANGFRWGGVVVQRIGEGTAPVLSLPKFRLIEFSPAKIMGLCVATEELVRDADALDGFLRRAYASEMAYVIGNEIIAGTGAGQCPGILNSPALITVAKEAGQAAGTVVAANIDKMWSRLPAPCRKRAVWLVNEDVDCQFFGFKPPSSDGKRL